MAYCDALPTPDCPGTLDNPRCICQYSLVIGGYHWVCTSPSVDPDTYCTLPGYTYNAEARKCLPDTFPASPGCPSGYSWSWELFDCVSDADPLSKYCCTPGTANDYNNFNYWDDILGECTTSPEHVMNGGWCAGYVPTGSYFPGYIHTDGRIGYCVQGNGCICCGAYLFNMDTCVCEFVQVRDPADCGSECPPGECWCEGVYPYSGSCVSCTEPDCATELHCTWDSTACDWVCDDPCPTSGVFDYDTCRCVDSNAKDVDATFDHTDLKYVEFRHIGDDTTALAIHEYVLDGSVTPVQWTEDSVVEVISNGDSPSIIKLRSGLVRLAYVDVDTRTAKTSIWDLVQGERYLQPVAANALEVAVTEDKWGRLVCPVFIQADDWYVTVGVINPSGTDYTFSTPVRMVDASNNPMDGVNAQCSIKPLSDGGFIFSYIKSDGTSVRRRCRALTNDGVGAWV